MTRDEEYGFYERPNPRALGVANSLHEFPYLAAKATALLQVSS